MSLEWPPLLARTADAYSAKAVDLKSLQIDRSAQQHKKKQGPARRQGASWLPKVLVLAVVTAIGWVFWPSVAEFVDRMRLVEVRTTVVRRPAASEAAAVRGTAANGYVVAERRAALSSDVAGRIVEMNVTEGAVVEKGFVVARLYSDEFRAALQRTEADLKVSVASVQRAAEQRDVARAEAKQVQENMQAASAQLDEAQAQRDYAALEQSRAEELLRTGAGSEREVERTSSELRAADARLTARAAANRAAVAAAATSTARSAVAERELQLAEARVEVAEATRDQARAALEKTDVRAPFDGVVVLKDAEVGEVVSPNSQGGSNARGAVCTMVDLASLEVQANVPENALSAVVVGAPADVFLDAFPEQCLPGRVDRIWPTADRQKATIEVRIKLNDRPAHLRPEMGVRIVFRPEDNGSAAVETGSPTARAILIPAEAIVRIDGKPGVFVLERDTVHFANVRLGEQKGGRVVVDEGLADGQEIVLEPPATLQDGSRVRRATS